MAIYAISSPEGSLVKIGRAVDVRIRFRGLLLSSPVPLVLLAHWEGGAEEESMLHRAFADRRSHGEWFKISADEVAQLVTDVLGRSPLNAIDTAARKKSVDVAPVTPRPKWRKCYPAFDELPVRQSACAAADLFRTPAGEVVCQYEADSDVRPGGRQRHIVTVSQSQYEENGPAWPRPRNKIPRHPDLPDLRHLTLPHRVLVCELGALRERTQMSLRDFGARAELAPARVRRIEHGEVMPTPSMVESWAEAAGADERKCERVRWLADQASAHGHPSPSPLPT